MLLFNILRVVIKLLFFFSCLAIIIEILAVRLGATVDNALVMSMPPVMFFIIFIIIADLTLVVIMIWWKSFDCLNIIWLTKLMILLVNTAMQLLAVVLIRFSLMLKSLCLVAWKTIDRLLGVKSWRRMAVFIILMIEVPVFIFIVIANHHPIVIDLIFFVLVYYSNCWTDRLLLRRLGRIRYLMIMLIALAFLVP